MDSTGSQERDPRAGGDGRGGRDRTPSRAGRALATVAGVLAAVPLLGGPGFLVAVAGLVALALGLLWGSRALLKVGATGLFGGVLLAGLTGTPPAALLLATGAAVVAWDVAENAVGLGEQLGRVAPTARAELVHAAGSAVVAAAGAALAYLAFRAVGGPNPVAALVVLLFAGVALATGLEE